MGGFNEIQNGMPDLGKTYWQDLKQQESADNSVSDIVNANCRSIFKPEDLHKNIKQNTSIFEN